MRCVPTFCDDLDKMIMLVPEMKADVGNTLSTVSLELQKSFDDMVDPAKQEMKENLVD